MITVQQTIDFSRGRSGRKRMDTNGHKPAAPPVNRVPRVSKLMALAIRFDGLLRDGVIADQSDLARLAKVTQARMTQIMNLLNLAPDIQEELLFLAPAPRGKDRIHEKMLRPIAAEIDWTKQRTLWDQRRLALGS
jgi:hypothetical protein